jgi:hypothetical protein
LLALGVILHFSAVVSVEGGLPEGWRFTSTLPQGNTFHGAWAAGPNDLFIGGEGGVIMRWNGQTWSAMSTPTQKTIFAMHGLSANDVWAVGGDPYGEKPRTSMVRPTPSVPSMPSRPMMSGPRRKSAPRRSTSTVFAGSS